ncbi:RNA methyltransferase [Cesiribacter sp. SM1]|uniref:RNA methyltransferase n=1 Tax=Cesiribacter sp. SM1 TaxID=2861196 RepID=UPI001CD22F09|nr:RNA methyltransferase [Cesiribacter sp. SM1]
MISKKLSSLVRSLHQKKYRKKENLFLVEGAKSVLEVIQSVYSIKTLVATPMFLQEHQSLLKHQPIDVVEASAAEITALGTLQTNDAALAVVNMLQEEPLQAEAGEWALVLDDVGDPGNLGTIIRIADWYGIQKLICSETTVDFYNPKVIAASKGSFTRVHAYYTNLLGFLEQEARPVYGADLQGQSVHTFAFPEAGYLLMGSESHGISDELAARLTARITIPAWGGAESLNVAVATAILCDNLRRSSR